MGIFNALDRFANGGPRSTMSKEVRNNARSSSQRSNALNDLAFVVANPSSSRAAKKAALRQLDGSVGKDVADRLIGDATHKVKDTFKRSARGR